MSKENSDVRSKREDIILRIGNVLMCLVILVYFIVLPVYFRNGYEMIASNKFKAFMIISRCSFIGIVAYIIAYVAFLRNRAGKLIKMQKLQMIDVSMLAFLFVSVTSYYLSSYKVMGAKSEFGFYEGALYGTSGWFMGLATYIILTGLYFAISRFLIYSNDLWSLIFIVVSFVFILAILNRYQIYPVEMEYKSVMFLSTVGHINWLAGFQSVVSPILFGFFIVEEDRTKLLIYTPVVFLFQLTVLINGSDSTVFWFVIMSYVMLILSLNSEKKMLRFSIFAFMFSIAGMVIKIVDIIFPDKRAYGSNLAKFFINGWTSFIFLTATALLLLYFLLNSRGKTPYGIWPKKNLPKLFVIAGIVTVVLLIIVITLNTTLENGLPFINKTKSLIFNYKWASKRGTDWRVGLMVFSELSLREKIFGTGPDTFFFALIKNEKAMELCTKIFESDRLTNAHNEMLTLLVNEGVLGLVSYISVCLFSLKAFLKESEKNPYMLAFVLSMISYLANNIFSFQQIVNTPFFFMIMGMGAAAMVKDERQKSA